jgi:hypothetical protein
VSYDKFKIRVVRVMSVLCSVSQVNMCEDTLID